MAIPGNDGKEKVVARLKPGAFFGEMSLLTGAPRSASVTALAESMVIEITKEAIEPILLRREELMEAMSEALAERQLHNDKALNEKASVKEKQAAHQSLARQLLGRMRSFFFGRGAADPAAAAAALIVAAASGQQTEAVTVVLDDVAKHFSTPTFLSAKPPVTYWQC